MKKLTQQENNFNKWWKKVSSEIFIKSLISSFVHLPKKFSKQYLKEHDEKMQGLLDKVGQHFKKKGYGNRKPLFTKTDQLRTLVQMIENNNNYIEPCPHFVLIENPPYMPSKIDPKRLNFHFQELKRQQDEELRLVEQNRINEINNQIEVLLKSLKKDLGDV